MRRRTAPLRSSLVKYFVAASLRAGCEHRDVLPDDVQWSRVTSSIYYDWFSHRDPLNVLSDAEVLSEFDGLGRCALQPKFGLLRCAQNSNVRFGWKADSRLKRRSRHFLRTAKDCPVTRQRAWARGAPMGVRSPQIGTDTPVSDLLLCRRRFGRRPPKFIVHGHRHRLSIGRLHRHFGDDFAVADV